MTGLRIYPNQAGIQKSIPGLAFSSFPNSQFNTILMVPNKSYIELLFQIDMLDWVKRSGRDKSTDRIRQTKINPTQRDANGVPV